MKKEKLIEKIAGYEKERATIEANTYAAEIDAEVAEYKKTVVEKYAKKKADEIAKIDNYKTLLEMLVAEDEEAEKNATAPTTANVNGVINGQKA